MWWILIIIAVVLIIGFVLIPKLKKYNNDQKGNNRRSEIVCRYAQKAVNNIVPIDKSKLKCGKEYKIISYTPDGKKRTEISEKFALYLIPIGYVESYDNNGIYSGAAFKRESSKSNVYYFIQSCPDDGYCLERVFEFTSNDIESSSQEKEMLTLDFVDGQQALIEIREEDAMSIAIRMQKNG